MYLSSFSAWVPLIAWGYTYQRYQQQHLRVSRSLLYGVAGYFLLSALTDAVMFTLARQGIHNLWLVHIYEVPSFYIVLFIYHHLLPHINLRWFYMLGIGFAVFKVVDWWFFYPALTPVLVTKSVIFSVFGLLLYRIPQEDYPATRMLGVWVNYTFSLYFFGSLALFFMFDVFSDKQTDVYVWGIHAVLNISKGLLVTVGLLLVRPTMHVS